MNTAAVGLVNLITNLVLYTVTTHDVLKYAPTMKSGTVLTSPGSI